MTWPENVDISAQRQKKLQALASSGIRHVDIRDANLVWNHERQRVMAIDSDRTTILNFRKRKTSPLPGTSPKPRRFETRGQIRNIIPAGVKEENPPH